MAFGQHAAVATARVNQVPRLRLGVGILIRVYHADGVQADSLHHGIHERGVRVGQGELDAGAWG